MQQRRDPSALTIDGLSYSFRSVRVAYATLFALLYAQMPLFTGNQHTKFLQAAAGSGVGFLSSDWTANTVDPLPAFTWLIYPVFAFLPVATFHVMLGVLLFVFAYAAVGIAGHLHRARSDQPIPLEVALLFAGVLALFSMVIITMTRGVANQYMLSHVLQPCVFGVFILLGLDLWLEKRFAWAAAALAVAAIFHPGAYLLTSTILLATLLLSSRSELSLRTASAALAVYLALVAPLMFYQAQSLSPTTPEAFARAAEILADIRIPHHTNVSLWFDVGAAAKFAWMLLACVIVRRQRQLFWCLVVITAFAMTSSFALWLYPNAGMRFSTPWRVTAISMPLATIIVLYFAGVWITEVVARRPGWPVHLRRGLAVASAALCVVLLAGAARQYLWPARDGTAGAVAYARQHAGAGQVYLVPTDRFEFRLATGLPILVSYKSHPYKDVEVLEWYERVANAKKIYATAADATKGGEASQLLDRYAITHVLLPTKSNFAVAPFREVYADTDFRILSRAP